MTECDASVDGEDKSGEAKSASDNDEGFVDASSQPNLATAAGHKSSAPPLSFHIPASRPITSKRRAATLITSDGGLGDLAPVEHKKDVVMATDNDKKIIIE